MRSDNFSSFVVHWCHLNSFCFHICNIRTTKAIEPILCTIFIMLVRSFYSSSSFLTRLFRPFDDRIVMKASYILHGVKRKITGSYKHCYWLPNVVDRCDWSNQIIACRPLIGRPVVWKLDVICPVIDESESGVWWNDWFMGIHFNFTAVIYSGLPLSIGTKSITNEVSELWLAQCWLKIFNSLTSNQLNHVQFLVYSSGTTWN